MPRPRRRCRISINSKLFFKPAGVSVSELEQICLTEPEFEAIRLKDYLELEQKQAAEKMQVSQPTFHRILVEARKKVATAFVKGMAIKVEGGDFFMKEKNFENGKILVSSVGDDAKSLVDARFGRAKMFLIVTIENGNIGNIQILENPHKDMQGGTGPTVAEYVAKQNIDAVITGHIGPRALSILKQFDIPVFSFSGSVEKGIETLLKNELSEVM
ncbi:MAG TPA: DUF134 domain-containing protein [Chlamydiales bacterium]|nr:DUF134 domain-containing protein [Chlamydiales bacterium]